VQIYGGQVTANHAANPITVGVGGPKRDDVVWFDSTCISHVETEVIAEVARKVAYGMDQ